MDSLILDKKQLIQKINRIAIEIYEQNFQETDIVVAGIVSNGYLFAMMICEELSKIAPNISLKLVKVNLDKSLNIQSEIQLDQPIESLTNKTIILVDDVVNTGRVLAYALQPFLSIPTKKIQTAVMIDRSHQHYPIVADYVGYSLATTFKEHVEVSFDEKRFGVYLK
ncbi:MAG: phosphoribosyltransferase [Cytophagales bacterium]|nr:MAG: phosphoribosyltransferase [Cytophagales bacterium]